MTKAQVKTLDLEALAQTGQTIALNDGAQPGLMKATDRLLGDDHLVGLSGTLTAEKLNDEPPTYRLTGQLKAKIKQRCSVTAEPFTQDIVSSVDRQLIIGTDPLEAEDEVELDLDIDLPDYLASPIIDLADVVGEAINLMLDPFPRAADVVLEDVYQPTAADQAAGPFAALAQLRAKA